MFDVFDFLLLRMKNNILRDFLRQPDAITDRTKRNVRLVDGSRYIFEKRSDSGIFFLLHHTIFVLGWNKQGYTHSVQKKKRNRIELIGPSSTYSIAFQLMNTIGSYCRSSLGSRNRCPKRVEKYGFFCLVGPGDDFKS